jgi:purine-binding chemotaxis protein CheW
MFDMDRPPPDQDTRIVVVETEIEGEPTVVGILADKVYDVTDIEGASIQEAPKVGMRWRPDFIKGIGKRNGKFVVIPDLVRIFEANSSSGGSTAADERSTH